MTRETLFAIKTAVVCAALLGCTVAVMLVLERHGAAGCVVGGSGCSFLSHTELGVVLGVPLPFFLVGYYVALAAAALVLGTRFDRAPAPLTLYFILFLTIATLAPSIALPVQSWLRYGRRCEYCLALAAGNLLMNGVLLRCLWATVHRRTMGWIAGGVACLCVPVAIGLAAVPAPSSPRSDVAPGQGLVTFTAPQLALQLDPSCEHCAHQWPAIEQAFGVLERGHRVGPVQLLLLPGDPECLRFTNAPVTPGRAGACRAAAHVYCAVLQGGAVPLLAILFQSHRSQGGAGFLARLDGDAYAAFERSSGLDVALQQQCTGDVGEAWTVESMPEVYRTGFEQHLQASVAAGLVVPSLYVRGKPLTLAGSSAGEIVRSVEIALEQSP